MDKQARDFGAEYNQGRWVPDYFGLGFCVMRKGPSNDPRYCQQRILKDGSVSNGCGDVNRTRKHATLAEATAAADALNAQQAAA